MLELFNEGRCCDIIGKESIGDNLSGFRADTAPIVQQYCGAACATNLESIGYIAFGVLEQVNTFTVRQRNG